MTGVATGGRSGSRVLPTIIRQVATSGKEAIKLFTTFIRSVRCHIADCCIRMMEHLLGNMLALKSSVPIFIRIVGSDRGCINLCRNHWCDVFKIVYQKQCYPRVKIVQALASISVRPNHLKVAEIIVWMPVLLVLCFM